MNAEVIARKLLKDVRPGSRGYWVARQILKSKGV